MSSKTSGSPEETPPTSTSEAGSSRLQAPTPSTPPTRSRNGVGFHRHFRRLCGALAKIRLRTGLRIRQCCWLVFRVQGLEGFRCRSTLWLGGLLHATGNTSPNSCNSLLGSIVVLGYRRMVWHISVHQGICLLAEVSKSETGRQTLKQSEQCEGIAAPEVIGAGLGCFSALLFKPGTQLLR